MQAYQNPSDSDNGIACCITADQRRQLSEFLLREGKPLLPMARLVAESNLAADELICAMGKAVIEAVLQLSAQQVAGPKEQGRREGDRPIVHHGTQDGIVELAERKLRVRRPRLRRRQGGQGAEVEVPAYQALRHSSRLRKRALEIVLQGVSTRRYRKVLPQMADSLGISKSAISRRIIEQGEKVLKDLAERRFDDKEILIIYLDGMQFAGHHILAAIGVDANGYKQVLGLCQGASENSVTVVALLQSMVERGIKPGRRRLFIIDGSKALRAAIDQVYGCDNPVQRCRNHKLRNVLAHLPEEQHDQAGTALRAAWKLPAREGIARLEQLARWYEKDQPGAAASIREGLSEMFTINTLGLPKTLRRCLATTNLIDSGHSTVRASSRRVTRWRDGSMVLRWAACTLAAIEEGFKRIMGCEQLWILQAHLDGGVDAVAEQKRTA